VSAEFSLGTIALSELQPSTVQAISLKPLTAETFIQFQNSPREIYCDLGTGFSSSTSVSRVSIFPPLLPRPTHLKILNFKDYFVEKPVPVVTRSKS
jgi:hypothetical protein